MCIELSTKNRLKSSKKVGKVTLFGKPRKEELTPKEQFILKKDSILGYTKFFLLNNVYYSASYKKAKVTNDTIVSFKDGNFGQILRIYEAGDAVYVLMKKYCTEEAKFLPNHIRKVSRCDLLEITQAEDICEKCVLISTLKEQFISQLPNKFESD